jgi:nucleoside-diphosphate-sugar epimerase
MESKGSDRKMHILIVGMGDTGRRVASLLVAAGHQVTGMRRHPQPQDGVDLLAQSALEPDFSMLAPIDQVCVILAPDQHDEASYRQTFVQTIAPLATALADHPVQRVLFVSSTSVYGQSDGDWVDEHSTTEPQRYNGQVLCEAEQLWRRHCGDRVVVVRPSGIYGPSRERLLRWLDQAKPVAAQQWSNRIHVDDLAGFLAHLVRLSSVESLYIATDDCPVPLDQVLQGLATATDKPMVAVLERLPHGKRLDNQRLKDSGFVLNYPNWSQGYQMQLCPHDA